MDAGEVERLVEIAGIARALAEIGDDDVVALFHFEGEAEAGCDRQVRAEHACIAEDPELGDSAVQRGIAPLRQPGRFGEHLRHHHARFDALHQERPEVAVQRADEILAP